MSGSVERDFERDWQAVRDNGDYQFAPVELPEPPEQSEWLRNLLEALGSVVGPAAPYLLWGLVGLIALFILFQLWRIIDPMGRIRRNSGDESEQEEWTPETEEVLGLLEDADRLAAMGKYDEATHLLLQRSVVQIREARPGLLEPSSTAREISAMPALPEAARKAFGIIAERVERSLFALRALSADDWQAARTAYASFALAPGETRS